MRELQSPMPSLDSEDNGQLIAYRLGFIALFIESTLPIPQFIANYKRKTCYGFRSSTLAGWLFGDSFK
jgi:hypothetical protein